MKALRITVLALLTVVIAVAAGVAWLIGTSSGAAWAVRLAADRAPGALEIRDVGGTLAGELILENVRFRNPSGNLSASASTVEIDLNLAALVERRLEITSARVSGARVRVEQEEKEEQDRPPPSLSAPLDTIVHSFTLADALVQVGKRPDIRIEHAYARGRWTEGGIRVPELTIRTPDLSAEAALRASADPRIVFVDRLLLTQAGGRIEVTGQVRIAERPEWQIDARAASFDPGAIFPAWDGSLTFSVSSEGAWLESGPRGKLDLRHLSGRLRGAPITGSGTVRLQPDRTLSGSLQLRSGDSLVKLTATSESGTLQGRLEFDVESLERWWPRGSGAVTGEISARGRWPSLAVNAQVRSTNLELAGWRVSGLTLRADLDDTDPLEGSVRARARQLEFADRKWGTVVASAQGNARSHTVEMRLAGDTLSAQLTVRGQRDGRAWNGSLLDLSLKAPDFPRATLRNPVPLHWSEKLVRAGRACLTSEKLELCAQGQRTAAGVLDARYSAKASLQALTALFPGTLPVHVEGSLEGDGELHRTREGAWLGDARISSPSGLVTQSAPEQQEAVAPRLEYSNFTLNARFEGERVQMQTHATVAETGAMRGTLTVTGLQQSPRALSGAFSAMLPDMSIVAPFVPQLTNLSGRLLANVRVEGVVQDPAITGEVMLTEAAAEIPRLGIGLQDAELRLARAPGGRVTGYGEIRSGEGRLRIELSGDSLKRVRAQVTGRQFVIADIPGAHVEIAPDLNARWAAGLLTVEGTVRVPTATINVQEIPRRKRFTSEVSPDVVVVGRENARAGDEPDALPVRAEITFILGEDVHVTGFGLDSNLDGQLVVRQRPQEPAVASGQIQVSGTYKAYGQDLTIESGQLLYADTPLDNPRLDITAFREVSDLRTGLQISGTAREPQLSVLSAPGLSQAESLSYLVAGRPLGDVGAEEGQALQSAARSLGTAAAGLLGKHIGRRLGIDQVSLERNEALGGESVFTIGEYLSPRLLVSYGVGLFTPDDVITLTYRISPEVSIQASTTSLETRTAVSYEVER